MARVNAALRTLLDSHQGVLLSATARDELGRHVVEYAVHHGHATIPWPGVLVDAQLAFRGLLRLRAAVLFAGAEAALSHLSALELWRLPVPETNDVHILTSPEWRLAVPGIRHHRRAGFTAHPPEVVIRSGLPVTRLERSLVDTWPLLSGDAQRAPLLTAVAERMTTPGRVLTALAGNRNLTGRAELRSLLVKLDAGCRSPLELWGYEQVFVGPEFARLRWQVPLSVGGRRFVLDVYDEETRTNVELDGAAYHSSATDRERDLRRDALLATVGVQTVRFTRRRLYEDPQGVRHEVLAILSSRALEAQTES